MDARSVSTAASASSTGVERLVLDLDQLERVLGDVAVASDDDTRAARRRSASRRAQRPSTGTPLSIPAGNGRDIAATSAPVRTPTTPGSSSAALASSAAMRACGTKDRRIAACRTFGKRIEVVDEPSFAAQKRLVLEPG